MLIVRFVHSSFQSVNEHVCIHLFFDLYAMISLENQSYCLHDLLPMRTHDLVDMLQTHHIIRENLQVKKEDIDGLSINQRHYKHICMCICVCVSYWARRQQISQKTKSLH